MKKICIIICALLMAAMMTACDGTANMAVENTAVENEPTEEMTIVIDGINYKVYKHNKTGVYYLNMSTGYGEGVCVMLNADGTPYTGESEELTNE